LGGKKKKSSSSTQVTRRERGRVGGDKPTPARKQAAATNGKGEQNPQDSQPPAKVKSDTRENSARGWVAQFQGENILLEGRRGTEMRLVDAVESRVRLSPTGDPFGQNGSPTQYL